MCVHCLLQKYLLNQELLLWPSAPCELSFQSRTADVTESLAWAVWRKVQLCDLDHAWPQCRGSELSGTKVCRWVSVIGRRDTRVRLWRSGLVNTICTPWKCYASYLKQGFRISRLHLENCLAGCFLINMLDTPPQ